MREQLEKQHADAKVAHQNNLSKKQAVANKIAKLNEEFRALKAACSDTANGLAALQAAIDRLPAAANDETA